MSLVHMPFPVSWFHILSALVSVLLKQMPSKGNFWQKSWACILCSSALHYVGTSRRESPTRSSSEARLWLWGCPHGQWWQDPPVLARTDAFQQCCFTFLLPVFAICRVLGWGKRKPKWKKKKKKRNCFSVLYLARLYHYIMQVHFKHCRSSGGWITFIYILYVCQTKWCQTEAEILPCLYQNVFK